MAYFGRLFVLERRVEDLEELQEEAGIGFLYVSRRTSQKNLLTIRRIWSLVFI